MKPSLAAVPVAVALLMLACEAEPTLNDAAPNRSSPQAFGPRQTVDGGDPATETGNMGKSTPRNAQVTERATRLLRRVGVRAARTGAHL